MSIRVVVQVILSFCIGCFFATFVVLSTLWRIIKRPRNVFKWKKRDEMPECLKDPSLGTHSYVHLEHVRLHYVAAGEEGKPLMLFVHGFPEFWYSWRHQIREFQKDYRVVAIDQRGYADSDKPSGVGNYKMQNMVGDLKQLIPALGYKTCTLVGHDWGGAICWVFAAQNPDIVDQLIVMNCPHPGVFEEYIRGHFSQFKKSWYMFFFQVPYVPELIFKLNDFHTLDDVFLGATGGVKSDKMTKEDVEAYKYAFAKEGGFTGPINYYRAMMRSVPSRQQELMRVQVPSLLVWGCQDTALEKGLASNTVMFVRNLTIKYLEEASHWVQMDEPEKVNEYMREFLKEKKAK